MTFCSPLILALAYYWTAFEDPFSRVNFFIATFPVKFLPWLMLLLTLVQGGDVLLDLSGIIASHAFVFLTEVWPRHGGGHNYLKGSADLIERWFASTPSGPRPPPPRAVPAAGAVRVGGNEGATGSVFGARGAGWSHRGQGQRLGG